MNLISPGTPPAKLPAAVKRLRIWRKRLREPLMTILLTIQLISLFVMPSLRAVGVTVPHAAVFGVLLLFVALAVALSRSRGAILTLLLAVLLTIMGIVWRRATPDLITDGVTALGQVLGQLSLMWVVASVVFGPGRFTYHRILGAVVIYLDIGMIFTSVDIFLARTLTGAFTHLPADNFSLRETLTYFSFSTLTTGSFGDILAVHPVARSLANLESICGQLFPATLLARIVSLHTAHQAEDQSKFS